MLHCFSLKICLMHGRMGIRHPSNHFVILDVSQNSVYEIPMLVAANALTTVDCSFRYCKLVAVTRPIVRSTLTICRTVLPVNSYERHLISNMFHPYSTKVRTNQRNRIWGRSMVLLEFYYGGLLRAAQLCCLSQLMLVWGWLMLV